MPRTSIRTTLRPLGVLGTLILGGAVALHWLKQPGASQVTPRPAPLSPLSLRFEPGTTLHYRVAWSGHQESRLWDGQGGTEASTLTSDTDMALGMAALVREVSEEAATLELTFTEIARARLELFGTPAFPEIADAQEALLGSHARVRVRPDGHWLDAAFEPGSSEVFMNLVQWVLVQSNLSLEQSGELGWEALEPGPFGDSRVRYVRSGERLQRKRTEYLTFSALPTPAGVEAREVRELSGTTQAILRSGQLEQLTTEEHLVVGGPPGSGESPVLRGDLRFSLRLGHIEHNLEYPAKIAFEGPHPAGVPVVGRAVIEKLLEERTAGMTEEELLSNLEHMGNGGILPDHTRWLWRATGLLKQLPALADALATHALARGTTAKGRALVLDLLASVGHTQAQAAMRRVLTAPSVTRAPERPALLQRLSFLTEPEQETIEVARAALREPHPAQGLDAHIAAAHAIAAASTALGHNGDEGKGRALVAELGRAISTASSLEERVGLLHALTNASDPDVTTIAATFLTAAEPELREAAANALRQMHSPAATEQLVAMLGDSASEVSSAALASLRGRHLSEQDWNAIGALLGSGHVGPRADGALLSLATEQLHDVPAAEQVVARIEGRPEASASTRARARMLLSRSD